MPAEAGKEATMKTTINQECPMCKMEARLVRWTDSETEISCGHCGFNTGVICGDAAIAVALWNAPLMEYVQGKVEALRQEYPNLGHRLSGAF